MRRGSDAKGKPFPLAEKYAPTNGYDYFDRIRLWLQRPLSTAVLTQLRKGCGPGGLYVEEEVAWFDPRYRQKIELYQLSPRVLPSLARLDEDVLLNCVEVTRGLILRDTWAPESWVNLFKKSYLQPWHRNTMQVRSYPEGYTTRTPPEPGERRVGHWSQYYGDRPCKLTGEVDCFHFEGKHEGVQFVRRTGIRHPRDLIDFDFDAYFTQWIRLYSLDLEQLGRYHHNKRSGAKRKRSHIEKFGSLEYNVDLARGAVLYLALSAHPGEEGRSLQQFIDSYGRGPFLKPSPFYVHITKSITSPETSFVIG